MPEVQQSLILVIDDDLIIHKQVKHYLEKQGYQVYAAKNGCEGLIAYRHYQPNLVLLDAVMPEMDGFECCSQILQEPNAEYVPILMITGLEEDKFVEMAFAAGATDYINKPIHWAVLRNRVKRLIEQHTLRKELIAANRLLAQLATIDKLTELSNRRHFDEYLARSWLNALTNSHKLALILADVDFFKSYNDNYGHLRGDECLFAVAQALKSELADSDYFVARYGGEEFAAILRCTDLATANEIAEVMRQAVKNLCIPHKYSLVTDHVTISLGVSSLVPQSHITPEMLIEQADIALYRAKKRGRDQVAVFKSSSQILFRNQLA